MAKRVRLQQEGGMCTIKPLTATQQDVFESYEDRYHLFLWGCAGTGKTFVALYLALREALSSGTPRKVIILRSAVAGRDVGFLPGTLSEKLAVFETPYIAMVAAMFGREGMYQELAQKGQLEFVSTSHLRGMTLDNCILVVDEVQNCTFQELDTLITRAGDDCRIVLCGDLEQSDLVRNARDVTGFPTFFAIIESMPEFECIEFGPEDIVRSGLVRSYILTKMKVKRDMENLT